MVSNGALSFCIVCIVLRWTPSSTGQYYERVSNRTALSYIVLHSIVLNCSISCSNLSHYCILLTGLPSGKVSAPVALINAYCSRCAEVAAA